MALSTPLVPSEPEISERTKIVSSQSDFPASVSGVITLDPDKYYELDAEVTLDSSIDLNDSLVFSHKRTGSRLTYTPSIGSLFVGDEGGEIRNIQVTAPNGSASLFNTDNTDNDKVLNVINCFLFGASSVGTIANLSGLRIERSFFVSNDDGLTIQDIVNLVEMPRNIVQDTSTGTQFDFVGDFSRIEVTGGAYEASATNTVFDITNITSITDGIIEGGIYNGDGTRLNGVDSNGHAPREWDVDARGLVTSKDAVAGGEVYITTPVQTSIASSNTPIKLAGTTATKTASMFRYDDDGDTSNRLRYQGTETIDMPTTATVSVTAASNNITLAFFFAKNGVVDVATEVRVRIGAGSDVQPVPLTANIQYAPDDYVEVWVENQTNSTNLTAETMTMAVR